MRINKRFYSELRSLVFKFFFDFLDSFSDIALPYARSVCGVPILHPRTKEKSDIKNQQKK